MPLAQRRAHVLSEEEQARTISIIGTRSRFPSRDMAIFALSHSAGLRVGEIAGLNVGDCYEDAAGTLISKSKPMAPSTRTVSIKPIACLTADTAFALPESVNAQAWAQTPIFKLRIETTLTRTKGNRPRVVYLDSPLLRKALDQYLATRLALKLRGAKSGSLESQPLFLTQKGTRFSTSTLCQLFQRFYGPGWADVKNAKGHSGRRTFITNLAEQGYNLKAIAQLAGHSSIQTTAIYIDTNPLQLKRMAASATSVKLERLL